MSSAPRHLLLFGCGMLAAGVAGLVSRYVFLPFDLGGNWDALLTGGSIGLVIGGIQQIRIARRNNISSSPSKIIASILLPAALVVTGFVIFGDSKPDPAGVELKSKTLPGISISLPPWNVSSTSAEWTSGHHELKPPTGGGRFLKVSWELSGPPEVDMLASMFRNTGMVVKDHVPVTVNGHGGERLFLVDESQQKEAAVTGWYCEQDKRHIRVMTFLSLSKDSLLGLHDRIVDSLACHQESAAQPVFMEFTPPRGFEQIDNPAAAIFTNERGQVYDFSFGLKRSSLMDDIPKQPGLREQLIKFEFNLAEVAADEQPRTYTNVLEQQQPVWSANAADVDNNRIRALLTGWYCRDINLSFIGMYLGPPEIADEVAVQPLMTARCP